MTTELGRKAIRTQWSMLGEWWCYPADLTDAEKRDMLANIRESLGSDFAACPLDYIEDRLFGGFRCSEDENRLHAYFGSGYYSFLAAAEGRYWPLDDRAEVWNILLENNEPPENRGSFTEGTPAEESPTCAECDSVIPANERAEQRDDGEPICGDCYRRLYWQRDAEGEPWIYGDYLLDRDREDGQRW